MVEIQIGQGASGGLGHRKDYTKIPPKARRLLKLKNGQPVVTYARLPELAGQEKNLAPLVNRTRKITGGVPVGAKIAAGQDLEKDLEILLAGEVDFIALDGAGAGTWGSLPIIQDHFGLSTIYAVNRAAAFLQKKGVKGRVSLIAGGGLATPGDFLKVLALGADAVYIGTVALFALTHTQTLKALPWEPPVEMVFAQGKKEKRLNVEQASRHLANFLLSCNEEIKEGIRALGKTSLKQLSKDDLAALYPDLAQALELPLAARPPLEETR